MGADYVIGDVQGCYQELKHLLEYINFNPHRDRLWLVGDLVNRGPDSLDVLKFLHSLPIKPRITLGNHDLHLLYHIFIAPDALKADDTLQGVLNAPECETLGHWLRTQSVMIFDERLKVVMTHAGIPPHWSLYQSIQYAQELESMLSGPYFKQFLAELYGNESSMALINGHPMIKLRIICNYFTRMRYCDAKGSLVFGYSGTPEQSPKHCYPWFTTPNRIEIAPDILFGHWSALNGYCKKPKIHALDTGCVWGGALTAMRLQDKKRFSVKSARF